ncbi:hypothetical protein ACROSR_00865 [Roseovarius tibetensis]|uniref:hypothetical protein n=1 Tax=Roseovarius tibetensis TaxID=2685897 RepID=UPI003D7FD717
MLHTTRMTEVSVWDETARALTGLLLGKGDLALTLCDSARQQLERLPAICTQRATRRGLADDSAQVFRHRQPGMATPCAVHQATDLARHADEPLQPNPQPFKRPRDLVWGRFV